jgi:hypothetical protein
MDRFIRSIDKQIKTNRGKNIFHNNPEIFQFINETVNAISNIDELSTGSETFLIEYATDKTLDEFCRVNQYYSFDSESRTDLRRVYSELFMKIRCKTGSTEEIAKEHYGNLKEWLTRYNPFAEKIYSDTDTYIEPVVCSEYEPDLQIDILQIDPEKLMSPVLDIGCGKQGKLVKYLSGKGIDVYGIDRFPFTASNLISADWLEFDYGIEKWGTIISNLGFSNHFKHHNLREDGNYIEYGKTYLNILNSLKITGTFHYAPDLPFIEVYLDNRQFDVSTRLIYGYDFKSTKIRRLK